MKFVHEANHHQYANYTQHASNTQPAVFNPASHDIISATGHIDDNKSTDDDVKSTTVFAESTVDENKNTADDGKSNTPVCNMGDINPVYALVDDGDSLTIRPEIVFEKNRLVIKPGNYWQLDEYLYTAICREFPEYLTPTLSVQTEGPMVCLDITGLKPLHLYLDELKQADDQMQTDFLEQLVLDLLHLLERCHQHMLPITQCSFSVDHIFIDTSACLMPKLSADISSNPHSRQDTKPQPHQKTGLRLCFWPIKPAAPFTHISMTQTPVKSKHLIRTESGNSASLSDPASLPPPVLPVGWQEDLLSLSDLIVCLLARIERPEAQLTELESNQLADMLQKLNFREAALLIQNRLHLKQAESSRQTDQTASYPSGADHSSTSYLIKDYLISICRKLRKWVDMFGHWFLVFVFILSWFLLPDHLSFWLPVLILPALVILIVHFRAITTNKSGNRRQRKNQPFYISFILNQLAQQWRAFFSKRTSDDKSASPYFQTAVQTDQPDLFVMAELCELIDDTKTRTVPPVSQSDKNNHQQRDQSTNEGDLIQSTGKTAYILTDQFIVGRDPYRTDLYLPYEAIGRQHARIDRKAGSFFITDLGSRNGTKIDGKKITARETVWLPGQCEIAFANHRFLFRSDI